MEKLPQDVIEKLSGLLDVPSLANCCKVNRRWRELFDTNVIWKNRCSIPEPLRLDPDACVVEPPFVSPEPKESTLRSVSTSRMNFMMEKHLANNWRSSQYKITDLSAHMNTEYVINMAFFEDKFLLVLKKHVVEMWTVEHNSIEAPEVITECQLDVDEGVADLKVPEEPGNGTFIVLQRGVVRVYRYNTERNCIVLVHVLDVEMDEKSTDSTEQAAQELTRHQDNSDAVRGGFGILRNLCVAIVQRNNEARLHLWNMDSGLKLQNQLCSINCGGVMGHSISHCEKLMNLAVGWTENVGNFKQIRVRVYNAITLSFFAFNFEQTQGSKYFSRHAILDKYLAIKHTDTVLIYNYMTSQLLRSVNCSPSSVLMKFSHYIVCTNNNSLLAIEPNTGEETIMTRKKRIQEIYSARNIALLVCDKHDETLPLSCRPFPALSEEEGVPPFPVCLVENTIPKATNATGSKLLTLEDYGDTEKYLVLNFW